MTNQLTPITEQTNDPYTIGRLMQMPAEERTPEQSQALDLHGRLVYDRQMVEVGIVNMCRDLKDIRDGKHYITLGYNDFGEYTEQMHGIGARQAYNYIRVYEKLGVEVLNLTSKIGVTKLLELASLDTDERRELLAAHPVEELEDISAAEVKRLTAEVKRLEEQVSMFEETEKLNLNSNSKLREDLEQQLRTKYDSRIAEIKTASDSEITALKADLKRTRSEMKMSNDAIKQAEARAEKAEQTAAQATELETKLKAIEAEKTAMEKQIRLSSDPELTRFKYMFEAWQTSTSAMFDQLSKLDATTQTKMRAAVKAVMGDRL